MALKFKWVVSRERHVTHWDVGLTFSDDWKIDRFVKKFMSKFARTYMNIIVKTIEHAIKCSIDHGMY